MLRLLSLQQQWRLFWQTFFSNNTLLALPLSSQHVMMSLQLLQHVCGDEDKYICQALWAARISCSNMWSNNNMLCQCLRQTLKEIQSAWYLLGLLCHQSGSTFCLLSFFGCGVWTKVVPVPYKSGIQALTVKNRRINNSLLALTKGTHHAFAVQRFQTVWIRD